MHMYVSACIHTRVCTWHLNEMQRADTNALDERATLMQTHLIPTYTYVWLLNVSTGHVNVLR